MLIQNNKGTFIAGPADIFIMLQNTKTNKYHPCFLEEHPFPDQTEPIEECSMLRLKSKMHHTEGFTEYEDAIKELLIMKSQIKIVNKNVIEDSLRITIGPNFHFSPIVRNWLRDGVPLTTKDFQN